MEEQKEIVEKKQKEPINISYDKLWHLLIDKKISRTQLREMAKLSPATMSKVAKEENITTEVISRICKALQCDVKDIMEYKEKDNNSESKTEAE